MVSLNRYPHGYLAKATAETLLSSDNRVAINIIPGDPRVKDLYTNYMSKHLHDPQWDFMSQAFKRASLLFGDFYFWLKLQFTGNDNVYDLNLAFLEDTVRFIRTGKREMSITAWAGLLMDNPDPVYGCANNDRLKKLNIIDTAEFDNYIGMWCHWDNGLHDMLCTLNIVFGVSGNPVVTRSF